jgi:hypothetical protein
VSPRLYGEPTVHSYIQGHLTVTFKLKIGLCKDRLCGLVARVPGYRSRGSGSASGATRVFENQ